MSIKIKVLGLVYNSRDEILMLSEKTEKNDKAKWNFVRGTYENAGESLDECMLRELREETGIEELDYMERVDLLEFYKKDKTRIYFVYKIKIKDDDVKLSFNEMMDNESIQGYKWASVNEIKSMVMEEWVDEFVGVVAKKL